MIEHIFLIAALARNLFVRGTVKWEEDFIGRLKDIFEKPKFKKPAQDGVLPTDYYKAKHPDVCNKD